MNVRCFTLLIILWAGAAFTATAQEALEPRLSPLRMATYRDAAEGKDLYIKLTYSAPHTRNRQIFGGIINYGELWRLGANEATELTTTQPININGRKLKAGTYSVFAIPEPNAWTIIINKDLGLWGSDMYDQKQDIMRFKVAVSQTNISYEPFTMTLAPEGKEVLWTTIWGNYKVTIPITY